MGNSVLKALVYLFCVGVLKFLFVSLFIWWFFVWVFWLVVLWVFLEEGGRFDLKV